MCKGRSMKVVRRSVTRNLSLVGLLAGFLFALGVNQSLDARFQDDFIAKISNVRTLVDMTNVVDWLGRNIATEPKLKLFGFGTNWTYRARFCEPLLVRLQALEDAGQIQNAYLEGNFLPALEALINVFRPKQSWKINGPEDRFHSDALRALYELRQKAVNIHVMHTVLQDRQWVGSDGQVQQLLDRMQRLYRDIQMETLQLNDFQTLPLAEVTRLLRVCQANRELLKSMIERLDESSAQRDEYYEGLKANLAKTENQIRAANDAILAQIKEMEMAASKIGEDF